MNGLFPNSTSVMFSPPLTVIGSGLGVVLVHPVCWTSLSMYVPSWRSLKENSPCAPLSVLVSPLSNSSLLFVSMNITQPYIPGSPPSRIPFALRSLNFTPLIEFSAVRLFPKLLLTELPSSDALGYIHRYKQQRTV